MRVALLAKEMNSDNCEVILDWPDAGKHWVFNQEYRSAFLRGCCHEEPNNKYFSGPLKPLGFSDSCLFTKMEECSLLQFCDLIVGATRDFVDFCMGKKPLDHFGVGLVKLLVPKYRGFPGRIVGRGIVVAPKGGNLRQLLFKSMLDLRGNA